MDFTEATSKISSPFNLESEKGKQTSPRSPVGRHDTAKIKEAAGAKKKNSITSAVQH